MYEMLSSEKKCAKWHCYTLENIHFRYSKSLSSTQYSVEVNQALIYIYFNNVVSSMYWLVQRMERFSFHYREVKQSFFLTDYILIVNIWG